MKHLILLLLCALIFTGCARRYYTVITRDNRAIAATTRPKLDKKTETYSFKDRTGKRVVISAYHIREIEIR